ncbi:MAG: hypothetical protein KKB20_12295 [Proteobacteria bacterium]|nr:hypothetical protein [Pseudomonadota bacterium]
MMTFGNVAKISTTAALAGIQSGSTTGGLSNMSRSEAQAMAIGKVAESNIIEPTKKKSGLVIGRKDDDKKMGLSKQTYNQMGQLGTMTAMKRAGSSLNKIV